jgi:sulfiredoxin
MVQFFNGVGAAARSPLSDSEKNDPVVMEIPLEDIRRPLMRTRANDPPKVQELTDSIHIIDLQVPMGTFPFKIPFTTSVV